jgi:hypothetical protein
MTPKKMRTNAARAAKKNADTSGCWEARLEAATKSVAPPLLKSVKKALRGLRPRNNRGQRSTG